jgi:XTP/dITP diphosphohydrolase
MNTSYRILLATTNQGKLREARQILRGLRLELLTLSELPSVPEPEETGLTFADNARLKALYYNEASGLPVIAEDSGLEIDALAGAPGVFSARYGAPEADTYERKFALIHRRLLERGEPESAARFVCSVAVADERQIVFEGEGLVEGRITWPPRGDGGFGYDPIFFYPPYGKTLAEVSQDEKGAVSHRGRAFRALAQFLRSRQPND